MSTIQQVSMQKASNMTPHWQVSVSHRADLRRCTKEADAQKPHNQLQVGEGFLGVLGRGLGSGGVGKILEAK